MPLLLFGFVALTVLSTEVFCQTLGPAPSPYKIEIVLERNERDTWRAIDSRLVLDPDDRVRFRLRTSFSGYLYVTNRSTSGGYEILFPGAETGSQNKLESGREYIIPATEGWFRIAGPPGQEIVYWLVSPVRLTGPDPLTRSQPNPAKAANGPALLPRCDAGIFRARGDCVDTSAGPKELSDTASLPGDLAGVRNLKSRDLVFIRQKDISIVSSAVPLSGPVIYEFRLAHR